MTLEERDYQEALRRIKEAEENKSPELDLSRLEYLTRLPPELARLTSLKSLSLKKCKQFSGDLRLLAELKSLQSLELSECELSGDLRPLAGLTSLQTLDLSGCTRLIGGLSPLAGLTSLQTLDLAICEQLTGDLSPLAGLTSLQTLALAGCEQLRGGLSPLAELKSLHWLDLHGCAWIRRFSPLESLLPTLHELYLAGCKFEDLPSEICGSDFEQNVVHEVRAHYKDLESEQRIDVEVKVLFLGNGGTGKTQLCRRLQGMDYDRNVPTTHGVKLSETKVDLDGLAEPVRLSLWDFGGQEIYHGSSFTGQASSVIASFSWGQNAESLIDPRGLSVIDFCAGTVENAPPFSSLWIFSSQLNCFGSNPSSSRGSACPGRFSKKQALISESHRTPALVATSR
jgi:internalin A